MPRSELSIIKREERLIKAEKRAINREYRWFMKKKDQVMKREAAIKGEVERRKEGHHFEWVDRGDAHGA